MTHDELLAKIDDSTNGLKHEDIFSLLIANTKALRTVVELHKPVFAVANGVEGPKYCQQCAEGRGYADYPCPTIQAIEKELM